MSLDAGAEIGLKLFRNGKVFAEGKLVRVDDPDEVTRLWAAEEAVEARVVARVADGTSDFRGRGW